MCKGGGTEYESEWWRDACPRSKQSDDCSLIRISPLIASLVQRLPPLEPMCLPWPPAPPPMAAPSTAPSPPQVDMEALHPAPGPASPFCILPLCRQALRGLAMLWGCSLP